MKNSLVALSVLALVAAVAIFLYVYNPPDPYEEPEEQAKAKPEAPKPKTPTRPVPKTRTPPAPEPEDIEETEDPENPLRPEEPPTERPDTSQDPPTETLPGAGLGPQAALKSAEAQIAAGKPLDAAKTLSNAIAKTPKEADRKPIRARLATLTDQLFFSTKPSPVSTTCTVVSGDNLAHIARRHDTTIGLIMRLNGIKDKDFIKVGQRFKIIKGAFDVTVEKSKFRLTVSKDGLWVREFKVGLGKNASTPVGQFVAGPKLTRPSYTAVFPHIPYGDKKNNPLGTRWITLKGAGGDEFGIHGTWEPNSIGKEASKGCIRMHNKDVEWLFDLIIPDKSKITVKP